MSNWMPKRQASSNMRDYLKNATLPKMPLAPSTPPMPPPKHKSHRNTLTVRPERYRKLHQIHLLTNSHFKDDILTFMNKYVPAGSLGVPDVDPDTGERIAIPCPGYSIAWLQPPPLRHVEELGTIWIEQNVLRSAQRVLQMLPAFTEESTHWTMERPEVPDNDHAIFRHFAWSKSQDADSGLDICDPTCSLVLSYQPPWVLSPQDFKQVTNLRAFPLIDLHKKNQRLNSAERVWGKLWDICKQKNCRWFILTSYSQWTFGRFSRGWTRGFISEVFDINSKGPTTLQCVLYWMVSSMEMPDVEGHRIAEVPEVVQNLGSDHSIPLQNSFKNKLEYQPSMSYWSGQSEEAGESPGSEAGLVVESGIPTPTGWPHGSQPSFATILSKENILQWIKQTEVEPSATPSVMPDFPSPVPSDWSGNSVETVRGDQAAGFLSNIPPYEKDPWYE